MGWLVKQPALVSTQICQSLRIALKDAREAAGLSFNELSARAGVNRRAISMIESGDRIPSIETFVKIAAGLGIAPTDLLSKAQDRMGNIDWTALGKQLQKASRQ